MPGRVTREEPESDGSRAVAAALASGLSSRRPTVVVAVVALPRLGMGIFILTLDHASAVGGSVKLPPGKRDLGFNLEGAVLGLV